MSSSNNKVVPFRDPKSEDGIVFPTDSPGLKRSRQICNIFAILGAVIWLLGLSYFAYRVLIHPHKPPQPNVENSFTPNPNKEVV